MKLRVLIAAAGLLITGGILVLIFLPRDEETVAPTPRKKPIVTTRRPVAMKVDQERTTDRAPKEHPKPPVAPPPEHVPPEPLIPEQEERAVQRKAIEVYKLSLTYAMAHDGAFPPDLSALVATGLMPPEKAGEYLSGVIEYRGWELTNRDEGRKLVMRYRIGERTDKEVRVHVSGSVSIHPASEVTDPPPESNHR
jgi:hypothetical protein